MSDTTSWTSENVSITPKDQANGQSEEEYIGNIMNIIGRPVLIVFGTVGKNRYFITIFLFMFT